MAFAGLIILLDPKNLPSLVLRRAASPSIGEIIGVQSLLQVDFLKRKVLYQVTQGSTVIEQLESRNQAGLIIGTASQVGEWKPETRCFDKFGWLPEINKPIMLADDIAPVVPAQGEYVAGTIPGTNFPVLLNKSDAVSHHTAILGVTGTGSFTRWAMKALFEKARAGEFGVETFCIVLEEAHTVVPEWNFVSSEDKSAKALINQIGQIALQGRKYGVGFIVIAQRTANVSKTILTQCNSLVAFKQFDRTGAEFMSNYMGDAMASAVANLATRNAVVVGKAFSSNAPVIIQIPEIHE
jgi:hypothetical protein